MSKVLLIEDETKVADFISKGLEEAGYDVDRSEDGENGFEKFHQGIYDILILDWMLPGMNGIEICQKIREENPDVPILMLTAKDTINDKILGLDCGADDYLTKPFAFEELKARLKSLLRRIKKDKTAEFKIFDLRLNLLKHEAFCKDQPVHLSNKEFELLVYFAHNVNKLITREELAQNVWKIDFDTGTNYIDVYINYLRNKLKSIRSQTFIYTVRSKGYIFKADA